MKREHWSLAVMVFFLLFVTIGTVAAQEQETPTEAESTAETEPAVEAETSEEAEPAPEAAVGTDFQTTVKFSQLQKAALDGNAGEIAVQSVEFEVAGAKGGGIKGALSSGDSEMQAIITTRLTLGSSADTKVKVDMMVEFLDKDGQVIDRVMNSDSFKKSQKTFDIKHTTLRWAVDYIDQARITVTQKE
jgi:Na+-transporting methylmalonyl-CoA/oxaloacetate decarboxylase gamma subunit